MLAHTIRAWHPIIIPGPLQVPDYTRQDCVEVAGHNAILIRDTKNRAGVTLSVPAGAWVKFTASLR